MPRQLNRAVAIVMTQAVVAAVVVVVVVGDIAQRNLIAVDALVEHFVYQSAT